jgi:hypothetical protein
MPVQYVSDRKGNGLLINTGNYVSIPFHSALNFGVQQNFTISFSGVLYNENGEGRIPLISRRNGQTYGYEINVIPGINNCSMSLNIWATNTATNFASCIMNIPEDVRGKFITVTGIKYNSNPSVSVSASEWEWYYNITKMPTTVGTDALTPLLNIQHENDILINHNSRNITPKGKLTSYNFSIFNRRLLQPEVERLSIRAGQLFKGIKSSCALWYEHVEKTGTTIIDQSGNDIHGTLIGTSNTTLGPGNQHVDELGNSLAA